MSLNIRLVYGKKKSLEPETKAFLDAHVTIMDPKQGSCKDVARQVLSQ